MRRATRPRPHGFTLIEVLVALAIVVTGIAALLSTLSSAADTTAYLRDKTFAQWVGLNRIAELRLAQSPPANGKSTGDVDYAGRKWHYEQEVQDLQVEGLRRIDVRVALVEPGKTQAKDSWTTTVSGIFGSALAAPNGVATGWDTGAFASRPQKPGSGAAGGKNGGAAAGGAAAGGTGTGGAGAAPGTGAGSGA